MNGLPQLIKVTGPVLVFGGPYSLCMSDTSPSLSLFLLLFTGK
jgi:hypothetical protein